MSIDLGVNQELSTTGQFIIDQNGNASQLSLTKAGNIGIGEDSPGQLLHLKGGNPSETVGIRLTHSGIVGSDVDLLTGAGGDGKEFIILVGGTEAFRIQANGNIGIGEGNPGHLLHLKGGNPSETVGVRLTHSGIVGSDVDLLTGAGGDGKEFVILVGGTEAFRIQANGNVGIGEGNPQGKLDVNGSIYQRNTLLGADYVFEPDYELENIEEHAQYMWQEKHLKAISKTEIDENGQEVIEIGTQRRGILEELEKAHIYIEQLHKKDKEQHKIVEHQQSELEKLKVQMAQFDSLLGKFKATAA